MLEPLVPSTVLMRFITANTDIQRNVQTMEVVKKFNSDVVKGHFPLYKLLFAKV